MYTPYNHEISVLPHIPCAARVGNCASIYKALGTSEGNFFSTNVWVGSSAIFSWLCKKPVDGVHLLAVVVLFYIHSLYNWTFPYGNVLCEARHAVWLECEEFCSKSVDRPQINTEGWGQSTVNSEVVICRWGGRGVD